MRYRDLEDMRSVRHWSVVTSSGGLVTSVAADATDPG